MITQVLSLVLSVSALSDAGATAFDEISNVDCPAKEDGFAFEASAGRYRLVVHTDRAGTPIHVYRVADACAGGGKAPQHCQQPVHTAAKALWDRAEAPDPSRAKRSSQCARQGWGWESNNPTPYDQEAFADGMRVELEVKRLKVGLRAQAVEGDVKGCKDLRMYEVVGGSEVLLAEDRCRPGEQAYQDVQWNAENAVAPGEDRIALALVALRTGADKSAGEVKRARFVVLDRRLLASVDLLDAGAGASLEVIAGKVGQAGFRVAHRGKAQTSRETTNVYYAKGFEAEGRELAQALGVPPGGVQLLSWKSPYALTIAAGSK